MISNKLGPVNEFTPSFRKQLQETIQTALKSHKGPRIAAFDADGTLWDTDIGETFFDYQIHHCGLADLPADPWQHYHDLKKQSPTLAYVWLAQINRGHKLSQVQQWAQQSIDRISNLPIFESQQWLVQYLRSLNFEIYIVTASIKWAVEPAGQVYGIPMSHILGITTEVKGGVVTDVPVHPITWRQGKAEGLLAATHGVRPLVAVGNTLGDIALLETATALPLAVRTQTEPNSLYAEEQKLFDHAQKMNWPTHHFHRYAVPAPDIPRTSGQ